MRRLVGLVGLTAATYAVIDQTTFLPHHQGTADLVLVGEIAATATFAALVMLVATRTWRTVALGLFGLLVGIGLLFGGSLAARAGASWPLSRQWLDLLRATFGVGCLYVLVGVASWAWRRWRDDAPPSPVGTNDRQT